MSSTAAFISELIRAANEVEKLTKSERARLLQRAAATIRDYRDRINYSEMPANDTGPGDIVFELGEVAANIGEYSDSQISEWLLDAMETIKACRVLLEEKERIRRE